MAHVQVFRPRSRAWGVRLLVWLAAAAAPGAARAEPAPLPPLTDAIVDGARLLPRAAAEPLRRRLLALREETGIQFVVLTTPSLGEETIEEFALRAAEQWHVGRRGEDNGLVLAVAPREREVRLEVGYGLEGVLPDVACHRLITGVLADHPQGMEASAVVELASLVTELLARHGPRSARPAAPPVVVAPALAGWALLGLGALVLGWLTLGRRYWERQPFRPLRPPPGARHAAGAGRSGTFRGSLLYHVLIGWLLSGRAGRGGGSADGRDDRNDRMGGGGGGFGGGGASGRW